jgi:hypothetical protein
VITQPLLFLLVIFLFASLRRFDPRLLLLCCWAFATVMVGLTVKGWCWRPPDFDVHRALCILPPLATAAILYLNQFWSESDKTAFINSMMRTIISAAILILTINSISLPLLYRGPRDFQPIYESDLEEIAVELVHSPCPHPALIYVIPPLDIDLEDVIQYFAPGTPVVLGNPPTGEHRADVLLISWASLNPDTRGWDEYARHLYPRPYFKITQE